MSKEYDKLIRDRIPEIIGSQGKQFKTEIMDDDEFKVYLEKKLKEETDEYIGSGDVEELVDIYEVILKILELDDVSLEEFLEMRENKLKERGGFDKRLKLLEVSDEDV